MKFCRVGPIGNEIDGVIDDDGQVRVLGASQRVAGQGGGSFDLPELLRRGRDALAGGEKVDPEGLRFGPPVHPGKIVCVGLNYADHAAEGGQDVPAEPILFMKAPDTVVGAADDVVLPRGGEKTDWEVELGVVIGAEAAYLDDASAALDHVAGYMLCNDISERHFQLERGGQWDKGKNCPTFCPMGPWLVTTDELPDPQAIRLGVDVNERTYQNSSTAEMIYPVGRLVHEISQFMTLYPGDVVMTGTPAGVGFGQHPPVYLRPGDRMRVWADGLGEHDSMVVSG